MGKLALMDFKNFYFGMPPTERGEFAHAAKTSTGYLNQVAYGNKKLSLGMADVLVNLSKGILTLDELPLADRAMQQRITRSQQPVAEAA